MNTDTMEAAEGRRLTVSQVKRITEAHGLSTNDTQDVLNDVPSYGDGTYDAQAILSYLGY